MEEKKVSKYQVIENYIIENIHSNIFKADDILPTESETSRKIFLLKSYCKTSFE